MPQFREYQIAAKRVKSLQWHNGQLFDWVGGGNCYHLDGRFEPRHINYAYRFDLAIMSPSGEYVVLYERQGTKGILLYNGKILREINRSFYHADVYEYPIAFVRSEDGRELLVHCPDAYNRLEIEDIATGERLTAREDRRTEDIFFSRLASSPSHNYLLMAGWVWHPWDVIGVFDIQKALLDPTILDGVGEAPRTYAEIYAAAFLDDQTLVMVTSDETDEDKETDDPLWNSGPQSIGYYDLLSQKFLSVVRAEETVGKIMSVGSRHLIGFYEHPKLFDCLTGAVVHRWLELATGKETSSIQRGIGKIPPYAIDTMHRRFAVAGTDSITVVEIDVDE
jgi:hypothetical protein